MAFRLLSCDGGGIRGYIVSTLIQQLNKATNNKLLNGVSGFSGTSTGGLISIALASGVSIDDMVNIYATKAAEIFTKNSWTSKTKQEQEMAALTGPGFLSCEYTSDGLRKVLSPYLGSKTLGQIGTAMLAVNSAQLYDKSDNPARWSPATLNNKTIGADYSQVQLMDAALATSAAPTYFPPHLIPSLGYFADGGTFANNPVLNGIDTALAANLASSIADIEVISFGTGISPQGITEAGIGNPLDWGVSSWLWPKKTDTGTPATPLLNLTLDLAAQNLGEIAQRMMGPSLVRINPVLPAPVALDEYTAQDYKIMNEAIQAAMNSPQWAQAIQMVNCW